MSKLKIVKNLKEVEQLINYVWQTKYLSVDFETSSTKSHDPSEYITIMGISFQPGSSWIVPLGHYESCFKKNWKEVLQMFKPLFESYEITKVAWNFKFEYRWLMKYGIMCKGRLLDGMLAKYCLDEERPMDLKSFVSRIYTDYSEYEMELPENTDWAKIPMEKLAPYCGIDTDLTLRGMLYMEPKLIKGGFYNLFRNMLMMATRVVAEGEQAGLEIDRPYLKRLIDKYSALIKGVETQMYKLPVIIRFEQKQRKLVNARMLEALDLEVQEIEASNRPQKVRMIAGRKNKKNQIIAGTFTGKVGKLKAYGGFNFRSPDQLKDLFFLSKHGFKFKVVKYTIDKKTKQETDRPSTDEEVLDALCELYPDNPFMKVLLKHRELSKLYSTYMVGIWEKLSPKDRIHAGFLIHGTVTGRWSSVKPNMQNIPRVTTNPDIKPMFIAPPGMLLLEVDYSQAELRVFAEMVKERNMIDIFKRGYNIHVATACKANGCLDKYDEIRKIIKDENHPENLHWEKEKKKAKTINFGILYGQGDDKLADGMGVRVEEAREFKILWFKAYPKAKPWMAKQERFAQEHGYVINMFGRKRRLPDALFKDKWEAKRHNMMGKFMEALRQSINAPIQGTASDFTTFSQVVIREAVMKGLLPHYLKMRYSVHDSIGYYIYPEHASWVIPIIIEICDNPQTQKYFGFRLKYVAMKVSPELGIDWGHLKEWEPGMDAVKLYKEQSQLRKEGKLFNFTK